MDILLLLIVAVLCLWPIITWFTYQFSGWKKWEALYRREVTNDADIASSVSLKKFGSYNRVVRIGIEDYGIAFAPTVFLLFHKSFCLPWAQILSYEYKPGRISSVCILHTQKGDIQISGEIAEVVARGCASHYVAQISQ
jgi:hypothetical protein